MAISRSSLISGPAKLYRGAAAIFTESDIAVAMEVGVGDDVSALHGKLGEFLVDRVYRVSFTPYPTWDAISALFPSWATTPAIGTRLFGSSDTPLTIWSPTAADKIVLEASALTKVPDLTLAPDQPLFGPAEFTGIIKSGSELGDGGEHVAHTASGVSDPGGTFDPTNRIQAYWTGAWGSVTGFGAIRAEAGWKISFNVSLAPVKVEGLTRDMVVTGVSVMASCIPVGPTIAQIVDQMDAPKAGGRYYSQGYDLVLTSADAAAKTITLKKAAPKSAGYRFGAQTLRQGELGWVASQSFSSGTAQPLVVFAS